MMMRILIACFLMASMLAATSCTGSWSYYSEVDKKRAIDNGMPYWEDVFHHCFPKSIGGMTLERYMVPKFVMQQFPPVVVYLDNDAKEIPRDGINAPHKFAGYSASIAYIKSAVVGDEMPFSLFFVYSKPFIGNFRNPDNILRVEIHEERFGKTNVRYKADYDPAKIQEKRESTIGAFSVRKIQFPTCALEYATTGEFICIMCPLKSIGEEYATLFETLLTQIDLGCIETQKW